MKSFGKIFRVTHCRSQELGQKGVFRDIISSEGFLKICDQLKIPFLNFEC